MINVDCGVGVSLRCVVDPCMVTLIWIPIFAWYMTRLVVKTGWRMDTKKTCHLMIELCAQICSQHNSKEGPTQSCE